MKYFYIIFVFLSQGAMAQLTQTGFNGIELESSYENIKKRIEEVESVPQYAWFAPMSIEDFITDTGEDSSAYFQMLETDRLIAESLNTKIIWCTFKKKKDANFFKYPIECAQLVFKEDTLIGISLVFDKDDMSDTAKDEIIAQFESVLGDGLLHHNNGGPIPRFERLWKQGRMEVSLSDTTYDDHEGESLNVLFGRN